MAFDNKVHLNMGIDETNDYKQPLRLEPSSGLSHNDHLHGHFSQGQSFYRTENITSSNAIEIMQRSSRPQGQNLPQITDANGQRISAL